MGFRPRSRVLRLVFAQPDLDGLEVTARSMSGGAFLDLAELGTIDVDTLVSRAPTHEEIRQARSLFAGFSQVLVEWNVEQEDGTPVPATLAGLLSLEIALGLRIIYAWMDAIAAITYPAPASAGDEDIEAGLPVEALTPPA